MGFTLLRPKRPTTETGLSSSRTGSAGRPGEIVKYVDTMSYTALAVGETHVDALVEESEIKLL